MNPMIDEPATVALAEYDIETRFRTMAAGIEADRPGAVGERGSGGAG